jgi:hypothetical protein
MIAPNDRTKRLNRMPLDAPMTEHLTELIQPLTLGQVAPFPQLGLRERVLTLPVMVALVLTMIWRQEGSPTELVRMLRPEGFLGRRPCQVTVQARSERRRTFPAARFRRVLEALLPRCTRAGASGSGLCRPKSPLSCPMRGHSWRWPAPRWTRSCVKRACGAGRQSTPWRGG